MLTQDQEGVYAGVDIREMLIIYFRIKEQIFVIHISSKTLLTDLT